MVQEAVHPPMVDLTAEHTHVGESAYDAKAKSNHASAQSDAADGESWETASLFEEILDEVEGFEYSTDGEC